MEPRRVASCDFLEPNAYPLFCNKSVVFFKRLSTPENPKTLKDPLSTNKDVTDLLCHTAIIAIPNLVARLMSLEQGTSSPQSSGLFKVQEERTVYVYVARAMGTSSDKVSDLSNMGSHPTCQ